MQPTTVALGAGAALGVAFLMSRATGEEEVVAEDRNPQSQGPGTTQAEVVGLGTTTEDMERHRAQQTTLDEWRAANERNANPTAVVNPASKVTVDTNPPQEVRGTPGWSNLDYLKAGGAFLGAAAVVGGGGVIVNEWSKEQAYVSPDGFSNALALEEGRPE